jgi:hypothetical protein
VAHFSGAVPALALLGSLSLCACQAQDTSVGSYDAPVTEGHPVDAAEITLQNVTTFGPIPVFGALTGYAVDEPSAAQASQIPLYTPYDSSDPAWWDELVAEQSQARVRRLLLPTRGASSLDPTDTTGPGNMNPRRLSAWLDAVTRADSSSAFEAGCFVDMAFFPELASAFHGSPTGTPFDLAVQSDWNDIVWLRAIKPWFDTIPSSYWWTLDDDTPGGRGPAVIQFGALDATLFANAAGNASELLTFVAAQFEASFGSAPAFVLDSSWFTLDPSVQQLASVVGNSPNFLAPTTPNAFMQYQGRSFGSAVAGFVDPSYEDPASPSYHAASVVIPRKPSASSGSAQTTLEGGLSAASSALAATLLQGFTDYTDSAGLYRSAAWDFPNQYLKLRHRGR